MTEIDRSALQARNYLIVMFLLLLLLDVALVVLARDRWAIGRILFTVVVMVFVVRGSRWAKWLMVAICSLLAAALLAMVVALGARLPIVLTGGSLCMAVLCALISLYLTSSKDLNRYFAQVRRV